MTDDDVLNTARDLSAGHELVTVQTVAERLGTRDMSDVQRHFEHLRLTNKVSRGLASSAAGFFVTYTPND
jgi:hypothetical protein